MLECALLGLPLVRVRGKNDLIPMLNLKMTIISVRWDYLCAFLEAFLSRSLCVTSRTVAGPRLLHLANQLFDNYKSLSHYLYQVCCSSPMF